MLTIKIFLASSAELAEDRKAFRELIGRKNEILVPQNIFLHVDIWEDFIDAISQTRLQDEYNKKIQAADFFLMLFFTKVGMYTSEEFDKALEQFKKMNTPLIYTYFKNADIKFGELKRAEANSVWDFQDKLKQLGHFQTVYENASDLTIHFSEQLDKLFSDNYFQLPVTKPQAEPAPSSLIPKCLSAGQPSVPPSFIGREIELADIKQKLQKNKLLLVNAEGGMGKTTLAAKYLNDNINNYQHFAWLFCENGINEQIKTLALTLKLDLTAYVNESDQLLALKTAMQNLGDNCLLVLDNANEPKHIDSFQKSFNGLPWHILLTSRCYQVLPIENEYNLQHLSPELAKTLFKKYQDENSPQFEALLDQFLKGIGYNTLMIELFSKNLHELSALGETLADAVKHFEEMGLLLGKKSFEIETAWADNVHKEAATTDQIVETLYDLTKLDDVERYILVNLALLPADNHLLPLLIDLFLSASEKEKVDTKIAFTKQLKALAQKGWLYSNTASYRINPVVQQIVLSKNKENIWNDAQVLVLNLNEKLRFDGQSLVNLTSFTQAQPYADLAQFAARYLTDEQFDIALLLLNLSDFYASTGNMKAALTYLEKSASIFEKVDKLNYGICLSRFGVIYEQKGNFKKALEYFVQYNAICKELYDANPQQESAQYGLVVSIQRLGIMYELQGNLTKAKEYFTQFNELCKQFYAADPNSITIKNYLGISYSRLGLVYEQQGNLKKALELFNQDNQLCKELVEANPQNETFKNGLAISYQKLGNIYQQQGDMKKAMELMQQFNDLCIELYDNNPQSEAIKNNLGVSYSRLGVLYEQQNNLDKALEFFEKDNKICQELFEANPQNESIKNGLAISYERLGLIYEAQNDLPKALEFFEKYSELCKESYEVNPESETVKNGLAVSYSKLGNIYELRGNLDKALDLYKTYNSLRKELFETNPESVAMANGLAASFTSLGKIYADVKQPENAKENYLAAEKIWQGLVEQTPEVTEYQESLKWVRERLAEL